jgi:hypothetical protein
MKSQSDYESEYTKEPTAPNICGVRAVTAA